MIDPQKSTTIRLNNQRNASVYNKVIDLKKKKSVHRRIYNLMLVLFSRIKIISKHIIYYIQRGYDFI